MTRWAGAGDGVPPIKQSSPLLPNVAKSPIHPRHRLMVPRGIPLTSGITRKLAKPQEMKV